MHLNGTALQEKDGFLTLIILKNIYFIALDVKRALKWYIFHQILNILKISKYIIFHDAQTGLHYSEKIGIFLKFLDIT